MANSDAADTRQPRRSRWKAVIINVVGWLIIVACCSGLVRKLTTAPSTWFVGGLVLTLIGFTIAGLGQVVIGNPTRQIFATSKPRTSTLFVIFGFLLSGIGISAIVVDLFGTRPQVIVLVAIFVLYWLASVIFYVFVHSLPGRRAQRERRQKLLSQIEDLAEKNPDLYIVAQLVRDDIAASNRLSGRQSLLQNALFFVAGVAVPYAAQYGVPYIQSWLNFK